MRRDYEKGKRKDILSDVLKEKFVLSVSKKFLHHLDILQNKRYITNRT